MTKNAWKFRQVIDFIFYATYMIAIAKYAVNLILNPKAPPTVTIVAIIIALLLCCKNIKYTIMYLIDKKLEKHFPTN